jgi:hypothetical protein
MIKKSLFVIVIFYSFLTQAQEKNHISIDPFLPVFGTVQLQYERGISVNMSIGLSLPVYGVVRRASRRAMFAPHSLYIMLCVVS